MTSHWTSPRTSSRENPPLPGVSYQCDGKIKSCRFERTRPAAQCPLLMEGKGRGLARVRGHGPAQCSPSRGGEKGMAFSPTAVQETDMKRAHSFLDWAWSR
ncbi:hypothetical protein SKAU_G00271160 [Synaphobranchus kaupii]|uniref:Uncharacterized protein n=1 Tax=Synaphobranchus kaupii TaxID=118154 RepID=A0A9Q1IQE0_SYNKA|nr:hypothetical protein SKAU_G00271160 [Synaphobranchus kaupii]